MAIKKENTHVGKFLFILLSGLILALKAEIVLAALSPPSGPDRYSYIISAYTRYEWWLLRWEDSEIFCEISIEHEGLPTPWEVYVDCGEGLSVAWFEQEDCPTHILKNDPSQCPGYYLHLAATIPAERETPIALPPPTVWITLQDCTVEKATNRCESPPILVLQADEPLSEEKIISINGEKDQEAFSCTGDICEIPLSETDEDGITIAFWANSSYGDTSQLFDAHLRVSPAEDEENKLFWYVDVLSSQWRGEANASCAISWDAFPPFGGVPTWLSTPEDVGDLESDSEYTYLAGNLIAQGVVAASHCPDFGLNAPREANACGLEAAQPTMLAWQNRFDNLIMQAAEETSIPAIMLKRLFAHESQFWPGVFNEGTDVGLGQLTVDGADIAFLWNPIFFEEFCPLILENEDCEAGYIHLDPEQQERLRGALVHSVNATCDTCPLGVDLSQADFSVSVFANTLLGSCEQTGRVIYNNTNQLAGEITSYEDLWKFTLVDYNAGAGCLSLAIGETLDTGEDLDWEHLSANLTDVCTGAKRYVEEISE